MILIRMLAGKSTLYKLLCLRYIKLTNLQQQQQQINRSFSIPILRPSH